MAEILFSKSHEYIFLEEGFYYTGVSDILLKKLGLIKSVRLPREGEFYTKGEIFGFLESENAACGVFMPVSGSIEAVNNEIKNNPVLLNKLPQGKNFLVKISSDFYEQDKIDLIDYNKYKEGNM